MLPLLKIILSRIAIAVVLFTGHIGLAAHAFEGDFTLPKKGESNVVFEVRSVQSDIDPSSVFQVYTGNLDVCCEARMSIAGRYTIDERTITFSPAFDFIEGQNYTIALFDRDSNATEASTLEYFSIQRSINSMSPEIVGIFPSGTDVPENTLRFYIHFSTPMRPHVSANYIKLLNSAGTPDTAAFMAFKQELWSEDRKRLTLLMDPGRIKRGVAQNLLLGSALQEGSTYSIVIEEGWLTANGTEKMPRFEKVFSVSKALRTLPDPSLWSITSPKNLTNEPLVIKFDRPFDSELLLSEISVLDQDGQTIPGRISIENQERVWRFKRNGRWNNSQIQIMVNTQLEDVAGNNFIDLLDHLVGTETFTTNQKLITLNLEPSAE